MFTAILAAAAFTFDPAPCSLESVPDGYEARHGVECGWVTVPLRKDQPEGETIKLWIARINGTGEAPGGDPVLYINGGPGIATVDEMVPYIEQSKTMGVLLRGRDLIVFDQRGSGRS